MFADRADTGEAVERSNCGLLPFLTPGCRDRRGYHAEVGNRARTGAARYHACATDKIQRAVVEIVRIQVAQHDPARSRAHESIKWLVEQQLDRAKHLMSQIPAHL